MDWEDAPDIEMERILEIARVKTANIRKGLERGKVFTEIVVEVIAGVEA